MEFEDKIMLHGFREVKCWFVVGEVGSGKGGRIMRWQGGKFYLFVSDVNQRNKGAV